MYLTIASIFTSSLCLISCTTNEIDFTTNVMNVRMNLPIKTYDGGNEALHPKVLYFKNSWKGYKYWLVCTPYKGNNDAIENPCIYVSDDGKSWSVKEGAMNPIANIDDVKFEYNSDPHLVYRQDLNRLECWFRHSYRTNSPIKPNSEQIFRSYTYDGVTWSKKELLYESLNTERALICPVVLFEEGKYKIWVSHCTVDVNIRPLAYFESRNGNDWQKIREITVNVEKSVPSHFDIIHTNKGYELVYFGIYNQVIDNYWYAVSLDNVNYSVPVIILQKGTNGSWDSGRLYRPSITFVDNKYFLYYSAYSNTGKVNLGLICTDNLTKL